jgi:hypothetical protein
VTRPKSVSRFPSAIFGDQSNQTLAKTLAAIGETNRNLALTNAQIAETNQKLVVIDRLIKKIPGFKQD